jgi:RNA polymerase sigma-70 factor (ECF subfamily)
MKEDKEERAYIEEAKGGSEEAFSYLFNRYHKKIYNFIKTRVKNRDDVKDLTSQTFEKMFKALPKYKIDDFNAWVFTIAINNCRDFNRQKKELLDVSEYEWKKSEEMNPEEDFINSQGIENIARSISHLSPILKDVITSYCFQEMTYKEIAQKNNIEVNLVCSRLFQARAQIRKSLKMFDMKKLLVFLIPFIVGCNCQLVPAQVPNQTIQLDANCSAIIPDYTNMFTIKGGCSGVTPSQTPAVGTKVTFTNQPVTITVKATGGNGKSSQVSFLLYGIDSVIPTITLKPEFVAARLNQINEVYNIADRMQIALDSMPRPILVVASFDSANIRHRYIVSVDSLDIPLINYTVK